MSYHFELSFKHVSSREEAMDLGVRFSRNIAQAPYADERLHDNIRYAAIQCKDDDPDSYKSMRGWLSGLFKARMLYWPKYKLAAIIGGSWPKQLMEKFGLQAHEFQDGSDQDYEMDSWPDMEPFSSLKAEVEAAPVESLTGYFDRDEIKEDETYIRCSVLYGKIYEALDLLSWETEAQTDAFEQMAFSGIYQASQMVILAAKASVYLKKWDDGMANLLKDIKNGVKN